MPGLWPYSLFPIIDEEGRPFLGARAFFYEAGTTTPRNAYADFGLSSERTWPVETDGFGRFPPVYLDDGFYRLRITTAGGVQLFDVDQLLVVGPSTGDGGGGGPGVDQDALISTGDFIWSYSTGVRSGFVRANGRSIGSSGSGATERANADTQPLYEHLWNADAALEVVGGRGSTASDDFDAGKALFLPNARRRGLFGLSGMGNSALDFPEGLFDQGDGDTLGSFGGELEHELTVEELAEHDHGGSTGEVGNHNHGMNLQSFGMTGGSTFISRVDGPGSNVNTANDGAHDHTIDMEGGGEAHNNMPPFLLGTYYIKL